jgi:hypothetical protein
MSTIPDAIDNAAAQITALVAAINAERAALLANYVSRAGATMLGPLILSREPVDDLEAACKSYVDAAISDASTSTAASGGVLVFNTPGTATYTATSSGYDLVFATGGGGGGGATSNPSAFDGGGGGAGATGVSIVKRTMGASVALVIGAAGVGAPYGATDNNGAAGNGGSTSFGVLFTATGGLGGKGSAVASGGGAGGTCSGANLNLQGGMGADGSIFASTVPGGQGGASFWGGGARSSIGLAADGYKTKEATVPGAGGGGAWGAAAGSGGDGAPGIIVIVPIF